MDRIKQKKAIMMTRRKKTLVKMKKKMMKLKS